jgi:signal transduction histidine kinase
MWTYFSRILIISSLVGITGGVLLSRWLASPLQNLEKGAQAIAKKELTHRVPVTGSREIQSLALSFNQMAAQLETAESLRQNLLADVAHELRHPVHILKGNLQAILDDIYPLSKEEIARLVDQTNHLSALINDLHELAQAEAQQLAMHKQPTNIAQLVKDVTAVFKPAAAAKQIDLQVQLLGAMPTLEVDASRLRQVLHNLLDNGLRHTPKNGRIHVTVEQKETGLQIQVADTGTGIAPDELHHVFDRFYRGDSARSRERGSVGLGLAIVRAIIEAHDGRITVTSPGLGQGSTFTITLP